MTQYIFKGLVLPERAPVSIGPLQNKFFHPSTGNEAEAKLNIILNQITVWVYSEAEWNLFDLRNVTKQMVLDVLAIIRFLKGYAYDVDIRQVINDDKRIDYVFGIDIPCLEERNKEVDLYQKLLEILPRTSGTHGIFIKRCLNDLVMAMKVPSDTGFYCFRAIEALRQYCRSFYKLQNEVDQWQKLCDLTGYGKDYITIIREFAFPSRHGDVITITSTEREQIFMKTWDVIEAFFKNV